MDERGIQVVDRNAVGGQPGWNARPALFNSLRPRRGRAAGGTASVLVAQEGGAFAQVVVTELGCTAGTCAVSSEDGRLAEGMSVRVDG